MLKLTVLRVNAGSCWAFGSVGAIEAAVAIASQSSNAVFLSDEELVDCIPKQYVGCDLAGSYQGCLGGFPAKALGFVQSSLQGLASQESYPYTAVDGVVGSCQVTCNGQLQLQRAVQFWYFRTLAFCAKWPDYCRAQASLSWPKQTTQVLNLFLPLC